MCARCSMRQEFGMGDVGDAVLNIHKAVLLGMPHFPRVALTPSAVQ